MPGSVCAECGKLRNREGYLRYSVNIAPRDAHAFAEEKCRINATQKRRESFASETLCLIFEILWKKESSCAILVL